MVFFWSIRQTAAFFIFCLRRAVGRCPFHQLCLRRVKGAALDNPGREQAPCTLLGDEGKVA